MHGTENKHIYDVIIIGGGPTGYTAAIYTCRAGLDTLILEKEAVGGQMARTSHIDNYPGFDNGIDGFSLSMKMQKQAESFGTKTLFEEVTSVSLTDKIKAIHTTKETHFGRSVILATGARPKHLDLPNENELTGQGIHYCASCDGMFYKGKTVMVVGGGNSALEDALLLSRLASKVYLVHRRDTLRAAKIYQAQMQRTPNIEFISEHIVNELVKSGNNLDIILKNVNTNEITPITCDGLFVSIGHYPASEIVRGIIDLEDSGYIKANESTCTNIPGVFVAGDVRTKPMRQIVTATADGAVAALHAENYVADFGAKSKE
ncbi:MAG: thioredoxin-disulfide reductase [Lachnospiraceae bacterium]|nr:thioredoxin-disulfide reductase [Lachnospiraceae bacterium]